MVVALAQAPVPVGQGDHGPGQGRPALVLLGHGRGDLGCVAVGDERVAAGPHPVQGPVPGDAQEPGQQGLLVHQLGQGAVGLQVGLLGHLLGVPGVVHDPPRRGLDGRARQGDDPPVGVEVSLPRGPGQGRQLAVIGSCVARGHPVAHLQDTARRRV